MATAFQIDAFQGDGFQIDGGAPAFAPPYYWKMDTRRPTARAVAQVRQDVVTFKAQIGLAAAFPIILGGSEVLRRLKPAASSVQARQTVESGTLALGLTATFPIVLGGTEKPRRLRAATSVANPRPPNMDAGTSAPVTPPDPPVNPLWLALDDGTFLTLDSGEHLEIV